MLLIAGVTLAVSLVGTPLVRRFALARGWVDRPGEARRVHTRAVPRIGGLAIYAAFVLGVVLTFAFPAIRAGKVGNEQYEAGRVVMMMVGATIVAAVMLVDDLRGLKPLPRLLWQIAAAVLVVVPSLIQPGGPNVRPDGSSEPSGTLHYDQGAGVLATTLQNPLGDPIQLPLALAVGFTVFWIVGMTNAINWIDGLDGLAGGVSVLACVALFIVTGPVVGQWSLAYLPLILAAATLGFLPYNIHPARIFMGDSGAMFLGFTLAVISIIGGAKMAAALLVLGVPLLDGVYIIIYRLLRGRSPLSSDRGHLHHRLLDLGLSQQQVVVIFYLLCGTFGLLGVPGGQFELFGVTIQSALFKLGAMLVMVLVLAGIMFYIARREFDRQGPGVRGRQPGPQV